MSDQTLARTTAPRIARQDQPRVTFLQERNTLRVASIVLLLVVWQIAGMMTEPYILPTPVEVAKSWWQLTLSGELITAAGASVFVFILGFAFALALGIPLGIATGVSKPLGDRHLCDLLVDPVDRAVALLVVWFGLTLETKLVWCSCPRSAAGDQHPGRYQNAKVLRGGGDRVRATRYEIRSTCYSPPRCPIWRRVRIAVGRAIIGVIVAELFTSVTGLGPHDLYSNFFQVANTSRRC
jgi:NitT/TauT family transport system permease protein